METYLVAAGTVTGIYILLALGLSLQFGFTGLINFGHVGFFAIGAYTSALLSLKGWPIGLGVLLAIVLAGLSAIPIGIFAVRLREEYLAIVTLAFSEIVRIVLVSEQWLTGGINGISGIPRPFAPHGIGGTADVVFLGLVGLADVGAILLILRIVHSPFGRLIQAIRDDETAVRALGKEPASYKMWVFVIGAGLAGLAGALQAHYITFIAPDQFTPIVTFYLWIAIILGGAGSVPGAVIGSVLLVCFLEGTRFLRDALPWIPPVEMASVRLAAIGLGLILFTLYLPKGIVSGFSKR